MPESKRLLAVLSCIAALTVLSPARAATGPTVLLNMWYADPTSPDIAGFWRPAHAQGDGVWKVDGKPLSGRDVQGTWLGIPYTSPYLRLYQKRQASSLAGKPYGDPHFNCWPRGPVSEYVSGDATMAITQTPGRVQQIFQEDTQVIDFYTDGRMIPGRADPTSGNYSPKMNGYSIGHWEGGTLVTETRGIRKELTLGFLAPHSDVTDVTERFTRTDPAHLVVDIRVNDRKALRRPMETLMHYVLDAQGQFEDEFCSENNRNATDRNGYVTTQVVPNRPTTFDLPAD